MKNVSEMTTAEILIDYNAKAAMLDRPLVKRFSDRAAAEKRYVQIVAATAGVSGAGKAVKKDLTNGAVAATVQRMAAETVAMTADTVAAVADTVAATAKTVAKAAKAAEAPKEPKVSAPGTNDGEMKVREGSKRALLIKVLTENLNKQVSITDLMKAVFGRASKEMKGPLMMNLKGFQEVQMKSNQEIRKTRENKENYFGLYET